MFIVAAEREFFWPVEFTQVAEDGAKARKPVKCRFRQIRNSAFAKLQRDLAEIGRTAESDEAALEAAADAYLRILVGWDSATISTADKAPLEFSREALIELLDMPHAGSTILNAYAEAIAPAGREERRRGN
ncbi:phage tail assembly chaperone [Inquilinus sp. CA228]|uniref:phage tail assembly chaperone n=1 Tax=Inquilinus sp. CA228 TaxID=3455609 RepID=UPI003F8D249F